MYKIKLSKQYEFNCKHCNIIDDFYNANPERCSRYLTPYYSERKKSDDAIRSLASRSERLHVDPIFKDVVTTNHGHLSKEVILHTSDENFWDQIIDSVDFNNNNIDVGYQKALHEYLLHGFVGILVDRQEEKALNAAEAEKRNERSYQIQYNADEILKYSEFEEGILRGLVSEVLLKNRIIKKDDISYIVVLRYFFEDSIVYSQEYIAQESNFSLNGYFLLENEILLEEYGEKKEIGIGLIPFVKIGDSVKDTILYTLTPLAKVLLNKQSAKDNINYFQSSLRYILQGVRPDEVNQISEAFAVCTENPNAGVHTLEPGDPTSLEREIDKLERRIRQLGRYQTTEVLLGDSRATQSADSKKQDMEVRKAVYDTIRKVFENGLTQVYRYHAIFENESISNDELREIYITISDDYGLSDSEIEVQQDLLANSIARELGIKEVQKSLLKKWISRMDLESEEYRKLIDAIDSAHGVEEIARRDALANIDDLTNV